VLFHREAIFSTVGINSHLVACYCHQRIGVNSQLELLFCIQVSRQKQPVNIKNMLLSKRHKKSDESLSSSSLESDALLGDILSELKVLSNTLYG